MNIRRMTVSALVLCAVIAGTLQAQGAAPTVPRWEALERQMWDDVKAKKWVEVKGNLGAGFQSLRYDGRRDAAKELDLLKKVKLGKFKLSDFTTTQSGNSRIVTYTVTADETIGATKMSSTAYQRMSVWQKTEKGWQLISHSSVNVPELPETPAP